MWNFKNQFRNFFCQDASSSREENCIALSVSSDSHSNVIYFLYESNAKATPLKHFRFLFILKCLKNPSIWSFIHICHYTIILKVHSSRLVCGISQQQKKRKNQECQEKEDERLFYFKFEYIHQSFASLNEMKMAKKLRMEKWWKQTSNSTRRKWMCRKCDNLNEVVKCKKYKTADGMGRKTNISHLFFIFFCYLKKKKNLDYYANGMLCSL